MFAGANFRELPVNRRENKNRESLNTRIRVIWYGARPREI